MSELSKQNKTKPNTYVCNIKFKFKTTTTKTDIFIDRKRADISIDYKQNQQKTKKTA